MACLRVKLEDLRGQLPGIPMRHKPVLVVLGVTLLYMPGSLLLYFGNIITYVVSYYAARPHSASSWFDPLWVPALYRVTQSAGMVSAGLLEPLTGLRGTLGLGVTLVAVSVLVAGHVMSQPLGLALYAVLLGAGSGVVMALSVKLVARWVPHNTGMAVGVLNTGTSVYALLHMLAAFEVINPDNRRPDARHGNDHVFTDPALLARVPVFFNQVGLCTAGLLALGFPLVLFEPPGAATTEDAEDADGGEDLQLLPVEESRAGNVERSTKHRKYNGTKSTVLSMETKGRGGIEKDNNNSNEEKDLEKLKLLPQTTPTNDKATGGNSTIQTVEDSENVKEDPAFRADDDDDSNDTSPRELLVLPLFWKVWFIFLLFGFTMYVHLSLFKQYGLTRITNDGMLVTAGMMGLGLAFFARPIIGHWSDLVGFKPAMVVVLAAATSLMGAMPASLRVGPALYCVLSTLESVAVMAVMVFYTLAPLAYFGPAHYPANMTLVSSSQLCLLIPAPAVARLLISVGWDFLFLSSTLTAALALAISLTLPEPPTRH